MILAFYNWIDCFFDKIEVKRKHNFSYPKQFIICQLNSNWKSIFLFLFKFSLFFFFCCLFNGEYAHKTWWYDGLFSFRIWGRMDYMSVVFFLEYIILYVSISGYSRKKKEYCSLLCLKHKEFDIKICKCVLVKLFSLLKL